MEYQNVRPRIYSIDEFDSIYLTKTKLLEKLLYQFFHQLQDTVKKIYSYEEKALEYINQLDNHLNQVRICQKVAIDSLPISLDCRVKSRLLAKLYWKITSFITKVRSIVECFKVEAKKISALSFNCICAAKDVPPKFIKLLARQPSQETLHSAHSEIEAYSSREPRKQYSVLEPTNKRPSLITLLECTSKLQLMFSGYVNQMENGLNGIVPCPTSNTYKNHDQETKRSLAANEEDPSLIEEIFSFPDDTEINEDDVAHANSTFNKAKEGRSNDIGTLSNMILIQDLPNGEPHGSNQCETDPGKKIQEAFTFAPSHKIELQKILFESSFFLKSFKSNKKGDNAEQQLDSSYSTTNKSYLRKRSDESNEYQSCNQSNNQINSSKKTPSSKKK